MMNLTLQQRAALAGSGIAIVPVAVEHASMLAALVERNVAHLHAHMPLVASLSSLQAARAHLEAAVEAAAAGRILEWHLLMGEVLCGSVRVKDINPDHRKAQIGFFLGREFAGKGIATCAARTVLAYCFDALQLNRIELRCASTNEPSKRVAERLGFTREGVLRQEECLHGDFVDHLVYGLLRAEFKD